MADFLDARFRAQGRHAAFKVARCSKLAGVRCSVLRVAAPLRLRSFHAPDLMKLGIARTELIDTFGREYPDTRRWSAALNKRDRDTHGMVWSSRPYPSADAMLLFGDRLPRAALGVVQTTAIDDDRNLSDSPQPDQLADRLQQRKSVGWSISLTGSSLPS